MKGKNLFREKCLMFRRKQQKNTARHWSKFKVDLEREKNKYASARNLSLYQNIEKHLSNFIFVNNRTPHFTTVIFIVGTFMLCCFHRRFYFSENRSKNQLILTGYHTLTKTQYISHCALIKIIKYEIHRILPLLSTSSVHSCCVVSIVDFIF